MFRNELIMVYYITIKFWQNWQQQSLCCHKCGNRENMVEHHWFKMSLFMTMQIFGRKNQARVFWKVSSHTTSRSGYISLKDFWQYEIINFWIYLFYRYLLTEIRIFPQRFLKHKRLMFQKQFKKLYSSQESDKIVKLEKFVFFV
jgi:hypothetical protein